jgi:hypothetical protein
MQKENGYSKNNCMKMRTDPIATDTINAWVSKMSLCMLLLASSLLFYRYDSGISIPLNYRKTCSVVLIFLTCFISSLATFEFYTIINDIIDNFNNTVPLLYSKSMLKITRSCYILAAVVFICTCFFISYLMITYSKLDNISKNLH